MDRARGLSDPVKGLIELVGIIVGVLVYLALTIFDPAEWAWNVSFAPVGLFWSVWFCEIRRDDYETFDGVDHR